MLQISNRKCGKRYVECYLHKQNLHIVFIASVDCKWAEWSDWSECSTTCGNGSRSRDRIKSTLANAVGTDCEGDTTESELCHIQSCPG